jgi:hypothetical protein
LHFKSPVDDDHPVARDAFKPATGGLQVYQVTTAVSDPATVDPSDQAVVGAFS